MFINIEFCQGTVKFSPGSKTGVNYNKIVWLESPFLFAKPHQWQPIGPWGGKTIDLAIAPNKTNILYALCENTVLKSEDYGLTWNKTGEIEQVNPDRPVGPLYHLSVHPDLADWVYLGGQFTLRQSRNGGQTWEVVIDSPGFDFNYVVFNSRNRQTRYATSFDHTTEDQINGGGIFKSIDGGGTWQLLQTPFTGSSVYDLEISENDTSLLYVSTAQGLFKSTDAGLYWVELDPEIQGKIYNLALAHDDSAIIYASFFTLFCQDGGVIKSSDGGKTWTPCDNGLPRKCIGAFAADPYKADRLYAALSPAPLNKTYGLYITENGGMNWRRLANTLSDSIFHDIELDPLQPGKLYLAADIFGIYASDNHGLSWQSKNNDINFISGPVTIDPTNVNIILMAEGSSIYRTVDGGISWKRILALENSSDFWTIAISPAATNVIYAFQGLSGLNNMLRSNDGGDSWEMWTDSVLPQRAKLKIDPVHSFILFAVTRTQGVFKSIDAGKSWMIKNAGLPLRYVNNIAFNPLNPNTLVAATDKGIYKSYNRGDHWLHIGLDSTAIQNISISARDTLIIYALTTSLPDRYSCLRRSDDGGINWQNMTMPHAMEVSNFVIDPFNHRTIWISMFDEITWTSQVFFSNDGGQIWCSPDEGHFKIFISDIVIPSFAGQKVFALTYNGLYRLDFTSSVMTEKYNGPSDFRLFQNYPNPFSGSSADFNSLNSPQISSGTIIEYQLNKESCVKLSIYNLIGQLITDLVNQNQAPGRYLVPWNGRDASGKILPTGIYLMKLETSRSAQIKKMVLFE